MDPGAVSSLNPATSKVVTHDGMFSVRIIIIQDNDLWGFRRGGQCKNRVYRGNINGRWKQVRGISGSFVWAGNIINGNTREFQRWDITIFCEGIIEAVIKHTIILFYHLNCLVLDLI